MSITLLENHLAPLKWLLLEPAVTEISINTPGEVWVERQGEMVCEKIPQLTLRHLKNLAKLTATYTEQIISAEHPLLSAYLPQGFRIQFVYPPAVHDQALGISIRKPSTLENTIKWHAEEKTGAAENFSTNLEPNNYAAFLEHAVLQRLNILISGGTSSGKTTLLNVLLKHIPQTQRLITIEDVPEIQLTHPNALSLFASRNQQGRSKIAMEHLVEASLRLRPDRIIIGELRGKEAFAFLRAVNTGHPGSLATLHADSPLLAIEQLTLMTTQNNLGLTQNEIRNYIDSIVDVIVQLKKGANGERYISEIYYPKHKHSTSNGRHSREGGNPVF